MEYKKHVDEAWKEAVEQEKLHPGQGQSAAPQPQGPVEEPAAASSPRNEPDTPEGEAPEMEVNFLNYVSSLAFQAIIFLGEMPNPMADNITEINLPQAKLLIDTMGMLREKTRGNLTKQEEDLLNGSLYELQMKYVEKVKAAQETP